MTLERVVSVTTFTNDNQVTTTQDRQTFIEEGYSTLPSKYNPGIRITGCNVQDPIDRSVSQRSLLRVPYNRAISHNPVSSTPQTTRRPLPHSASTPACHAFFRSSTTLNRTPSDIHNNNHTPISYTRSRYRKHDRCVKISSRPREVVLDFPSVSKSRSESALCDRTPERSSPKQDCNGNITNGTITNSSVDIPNHDCSSPDSHKQPKACALSYVFPWSGKSSRRRFNSASEDPGKKDIGKSIRSSRPGSTSVHSTKASLGDLFSSSSHIDRPESDQPLSPKSTPAKPRFYFDPDEEEEENLPQQRLRPCPDNSRARSDHRHKHKSSHVFREKSEDAFREGSGGTQSQRESRKPLRDSNNRVSSSRSHPSPSHREVQATSSSGASGRTKSQHRDCKTDQEECSQCHNSTDCSRKSESVRSVDSELEVTLTRFHPEADTTVITDADDFVYRPTDMKGPLHLSFCGCGFLGMYHLGVVSSLLQRAPTFLERVEKFAGASAGALMAALLVTSRDKVEESVLHFHSLSKEIRSKPLGALTPGFSLARSLRCMLDDILPEDAHLDASGRLFVSVTNGSTKKNEILSQFPSREELIEVLVASCYIPLYAGSKLPTVKGQRYMDGGLTNNLLQFETGRTITVSPFDGKSDIGPKVGQEASPKSHFINLQNQSLQMNMQNIKRGAHAFFPPRRPILQGYFDKGRNDASRFLIREGLYEIQVQQQTQSVVYESSV